MIILRCIVAVICVLHAGWHWYEGNDQGAFGWLIAGGVWLVGV